MDKPRSLPPSPRLRLLALRLLFYPPSPRSGTKRLSKFSTSFRQSFDPEPCPIQPFPASSPSPPPGQPVFQDTVHQSLPPRFRASPLLPESTSGPLPHPGPSFSNLLLPVLACDSVPRSGSSFLNPRQTAYRKPFALSPAPHFSLFFQKRV